MKNVFILFFLILTIYSNAQKATNAEEPPALEVFELQNLLDTLDQSKRPYLPFLNRSTLRCGIYTLKADATDHQKPHDMDEVYYVLEGAGRFTVNEEDIAIKEGDILFVEAHAEHRFHSIIKDLKLLVFFSAAKVD